MNPPRRPRGGVLQTIGRCLASRGVCVALGLAMALPMGRHAAAAGFGFVGASPGADRWLADLSRDEEARCDQPGSGCFERVWARRQGSRGARTGR